MHNHDSKRLSWLGIQVYEPMPSDLMVHHVLRTIESQENWIFEYKKSVDRLLLCHLIPTNSVIPCRALLHRLHQEFPSMLIFALVDWWVPLYLKRFTLSSLFEVPQAHVTNFILCGHAEAVAHGISHLNGDIASGIQQVWPLFVHTDLGALEWGWRHHVTVRSCSDTTFTRIEGIRYKKWFILCTSILLAVTYSTLWHAKAFEWSSKVPNSKRNWSSVSECQWVPAVCDVKWLGLRNRDALTYVPATAFTSLTDRDMTQARSLLASKMLQVWILEQRLGLVLQKNLFFILCCSKAA